MILVFCNENGYYVMGEGVEATQHCSPALNDDGTTILSSLILSYIALANALRTLTGIRIEGDIIVYANTRIIEELNGSAEPLDEISNNWKKYIRQNILPLIRSVVLFRKKSGDYIARNIHLGNERLLVSTPMDLIKNQNKNRKANLVNKFKERWLWAKDQQTYNTD